MARRFPAIFGWTILLPTLLGGLVLPITFLLVQRGSLTISQTVNASTLTSVSSASGSKVADRQLDSPVSSKGPESAHAADSSSRYQLTYQQWVTQLGKEAEAIAQRSPARLHILAGDSLSLWFPVEQLPQGATWLNQGISGETSMGLLRRLKLFDQTQPRIIFVMVGINDLVRGVSEETVVANHREIARHLKVAHPTARIVIQSILPHGDNRLLQQYFPPPLTSDSPAADPSTRPLWIDRLPMISNDSIRKINDRLEIVAREEQAEYLDLHPVFMDEKGDLQANLTTDGLHLSSRGYAVWRSQLERYDQPLAKTVLNPATRLPSK